MSLTLFTDPSGARTDLRHGTRTCLSFSSLGAFLDADATQDMQPVTLRQVSSLATPSGAVVAFAMPNPPSGWLKCNGQAVSRTTYSRLFAAIGTTYGAGNGSTTFNLPDLRGEFVRGWDEGRGADTGRTFGSWQDQSGGSFTAVAYSDDGDADPAKSYKSISGLTLGGVSIFDNYTAGNAGVQKDIPVTGGKVQPRNVALAYFIKT